MSSGLNTSASKSIGQQLPEILEILSLLYGKAIAARAAELIGDPSKFLEAPATTRMQLQNLLRENHARLVPTPENARRLLATCAVLDRIREQLRLDEERHCSTSVVGAQTLAFLRASRAALDRDQYRRATLEADGLQVADVLHPSIGAFGDGDTEPVFESIVRHVADSMRRAAESWYRPMLASMLRLTFDRLNSVAAVNTELGTLMVQCGAIWRERGGPITALFDPIRLVRNSESHRNTIVDVHAETITFVNRPGTPKEQRLGPMDRLSFCAFVDTFFEHCRAIRGAFAAVAED